MLMTLLSLERVGIADTLSSQNCLRIKCIWYHTLEKMFLKTLI